MIFFGSCHFCYLFFGCVCVFCLIPIARGSYEGKLVTQAVQRYWKEKKLQVALLQATGTTPNTDLL